MNTLLYFLFTPTCLHILPPLCPDDTLNTCLPSSSSQLPRGPLNVSLMSSPLSAFISFHHLILCASFVLFLFITPICPISLRLQCLHKNSVHLRSPASNLHPVSLSSSIFWKSPSLQLQNPVVSGPEFLSLFHLKAMWGNTSEIIHHHAFNLQLHTREPISR